MKHLFFHRRRIQKAALANVDVELISLLFDDIMPANQRGAIYKSASGGHSVITSSRKIKSITQGDQGLIYCTIMEPDIADFQGDTYTAAEIAKAAHAFAAKGLVGRNDINHNFTPVPEFMIAESYILKSADPQHFPDTRIGSWVGVIKCLDLSSPYWQKVAKGALNGVSIAGSATSLAPADNSALITELKSQIDAIAKAAKAAPGTDPTPALATLQTRIAELETQDASAASNALIKSLTSEIQQLSVSLSKAISTSVKGEPATAPSDSSVDIDGVKLILKSQKMELYKSIANVDAGAPMNILTPTTTALFIDEVISSDPSDTLKDITVVPLLKDEKIDVGTVADLVFKNSEDGAVSSQNIASADIACPTGILHAEFSLRRDTVEFYKDKYGEAAFGAYVERHIARKAEKAIRKLLFSGSRSSSTPALKALDGIIALAEESDAITTIDGLKNINWDEKLEAALLEFSDDVLEEMEDFVFYVSHKDHIRIKAEVARRNSPAGDKFLLEGGKLSYSGIPVKPRFMPDSNLIAGLSRFIIVGYRTDAELKVEHHGSDWKYHWYIRIRPGITYIDGPIRIFDISFAEDDDLDVEAA